VRYLTNLAVFWPTVVDRQRYEEDKKVSRDVLPEITTEGYTVFARFKQMLGKGLVTKLVHNT
jgi:hypothetical protein